jgi:hypothetical protein
MASTSGRCFGPAELGRIFFLIVAVCGLPVGMMTFGRVMATASNNSSSRVVKKSLRFHELEDQEFLIDNFL